MLSEAFYPRTLLYMKLGNNTDLVALGHREMNSLGIVGIIVHLHLGRVNGQLKQVNCTLLVVA